MSVLGVGVLPQGHSGLAEALLCLLSCSQPRVVGSAC